MYEAFYGLRERPFDLTPNPRFLFMTRGHREALSALQYGITGRKGTTLLLGPAGTGKTTLVHAALEQHGGSDTAAIVLSNPTLTRSEFTEFIALELGLSADAARSKTRFLRELEAVLRERSAAGHITALIVDEAQAMPEELLEEVRLLANMETATDKLFPVVLVGQLELAERLNGHRLLQLKQRVALRATLTPLDARETATYIAERIRVAGGSVRSIFDPDAVAAVCEASHGIPRVISVICDNALVSGFALDQRPIGRDIVAEVCRDFDLAVPADPAGTQDDFVTAAVGLTGPRAVAPATPPEHRAADPSNVLAIPSAASAPLTPSLSLVAPPGQRSPKPAAGWKTFRSLFTKAGER